MSEDPIAALIVLRNKGREYKDLPKAKKRRLVTSAVMNSIVNVPDEIRNRLIEFWKEIPKLMTVEELIICQRAYNAMTDGKKATEDAQLLLNTAYGLASVDSDIVETTALAELTKDKMQEIEDELKREY